MGVWSAAMADAYRRGLWAGNQFKKAKVGHAAQLAAAYRLANQEAFAACFYQGFSCKAGIPIARLPTFGEVPSPSCSVEQMLDAAKRIDHLCDLAPHNALHYLHNALQDLARMPETQALAAESRGFTPEEAQSYEAFIDDQFGPSR